jgi:hypothetical protein
VRGRVREGDVPPPAPSAKLNVPPLYKVNGKLKRGPLQHLKMATGSVLKSFYMLLLLNLSPVRFSTNKYPPLIVYMCSTINGEKKFPLQVRGSDCPSPLNTALM